jgi:uncharacterized protein YcfJ
LGTLLRSIVDSSPRLSPYFSTKFVALSLICTVTGSLIDFGTSRGMTMRTLIGAVAGAMAVVAMLVSYDLGSRRALNRDLMTPTTQMMMGPDGVARPYLVQAGQGGQSAYGQPLAGQPYGWSPYTAMAPTAIAPYAYSGYPQAGYAPPQAQPQYVTERVVAERPVVRRVSTQRTASEVAPRRTWQKSALLIGGSAGAGAGVGALMGGKKGALAGAAIGGGAAAIFDQVKRR